MKEILTFGGGGGSKRSNVSFRRFRPKKKPHTHTTHNAQHINTHTRTTKNGSCTDDAVRRRQKGTTLRHASRQFAQFTQKPKGVHFVWHVCRHPTPLEEVARAGQTVLQTAAALCGVRHRAKPARHPCSRSAMGLAWMVTLVMTMSWTGQSGRPAT